MVYLGHMNNTKLWYVGQIKYLSIFLRGKTYYLPVFLYLKKQTYFEMSSNQKMNGLKNSTVWIIIEQRNSEWREVWKHTLIWKTTGNKSCVII